MKVIPVIDLKSGAVVHARRGERALYRPIVSDLCRGSRPLDVVRALLAVHPFDTLYIADLDAIQGGGGHDREIAALARCFPGLELWVDSGVADEASCRARLKQHPGVMVIGSEAIRDVQLWAGLRRLSAERLVLSLDFKGEQFLGPPDLLSMPETWPERVIVMTLSRVGSDAGPDLARLAGIARLAGARKIFAAGGVRGGEDLCDLSRRDVAGVLVASALHDRRIGPAEIAAVANGTATV